MTNKGNSGLKSAAFTVRGARETGIEEAKAREALERAKEKERELLSRNRLTTVRTLNGTVYTTHPERYEEYNRRFNIK